MAMERTWSGAAQPCYLAFDIETVPDWQDGGRIHLDDPSAAAEEAVFKEPLGIWRRQKTNGSDFFPHHLQRVVAISVLIADTERFRLWSLGEVTASEQELIQRFFQGIERYKPILVSWNGGGFDLPVLHYRALKYGIQAPQYWEVGEQDAAFKWNNYLNRYHYRHMDLMDILSGYQSRASASLDEVAQLVGLPGKQVLCGAEVANAFEAHDLESIRHYCEIDVLNTYLVFLRLQKMRGAFSSTGLAELKERAWEFMSSESAPAHIRLFFGKLVNAKWDL